MLACLMAPEAMPIHSLGLGKDTGFSAAILTAHNSAERARAKAIPIATIANPPTMQATLFIPHNLSKAPFQDKTSEPKFLQKSICPMFQVAL